MSNTPAATPEPSLISSLRSVRDLFPWLALGDAATQAPSLIAMALSLLAVWLHPWGVVVIDDWFDMQANNRPMSAFSLPISSWTNGIDYPFIGCGVYFGAPMWQLSSDTWTLRDLSHALLQQVWLWIVWLIPAAYVLRRTVLFVARRPPMATGATIRFALHRSSAMIGGPSLALLGILAVFGMFLLIGLLANVPWLGVPLGWLAFPVAVATGVLWLGIVLGTPMMWASAMIEEFADAFDICSRAVEYLLQRPIRLVVYIALATLTSVVLVYLVRLAVHWGLVLATSAGTWTAEAPALSSLGAFERAIVQAYAMNLFFAQCAVIYLLLRRDANHQEMDDLWEPSWATQQPLPELRVDERGVPIPPTSK